MIAPVLFLKRNYNSTACCQIFRLSGGLGCSFGFGVQGLGFCQSAAVSVPHFLRRCSSTPVSAFLCCASTRRLAWWQQNSGLPRGELRGGFVHGAPGQIRAGSSTAAAAFNAGLSATPRKSLAMTQRPSKGLPRKSVLVATSWRLWGRWMKECCKVPPEDTRVHRCSFVPDARLRPAAPENGNLSSVR